MLNLLSGSSNSSNSTNVTPLPLSSSAGGFSIPEFRTWHDVLRHNFKEKARGLGREIDLGKKRLRGELLGRGKSEYVIAGGKKEENGGKGDI